MCVDKRTESLTVPFPPLGSCRKSNLSSKFTFSFNADSIVDLLVENCYPHFPGEKWDKESSRDSIWQNQAYSQDDKPKIFTSVCSPPL